MNIAINAKRALFLVFHKMLHQLVSKLTMKEKRAKIKYINKTDPDNNLDRHH